MSSNIKVKTKRIDHLGIVAGVIDDLNLVKEIDARVGSNSQEHVTAGECFKAMLLNGLGLNQTATYLTPEFFESKPLKTLFGRELAPEHFNATKLARVLDKLYSYGLESLFAELSSLICVKEQVDTQFNSLDTTSFSLQGAFSGFNLQLFPLGKTALDAVNEQIVLWQKTEIPSKQFLLVEREQSWFFYGYSATGQRYNSIPVKELKGLSELLAVKYSRPKEKTDTILEHLLTSLGYQEPEEERCVLVTKGHSKDHRPDLNQIVHELLVSQDGGVPLMSKTWDGNESDSRIFRERSKHLVELLGKESMRYVVADSKLYSEKTALSLRLLKFITRIPSAIKEEGLTVQAAIDANDWMELNDKNKYYIRELTHNKIHQRWITIWSEAAHSRAEKYVRKNTAKEKEAFQNELSRQNKEGFDCEKDAIRFIEKLKKKYQRYHNLKAQVVCEKNKSTAHCTINGVLTRNENKRAQIEQQKSCYVIGTNIPKETLSVEAVVNGYKGQNTSVENQGFKFLKDARFFAKGFFVKSAKRLESTVFIMTMCLLVFTIAQRRIQAFVVQDQATIQAAQSRVETKALKIKGVAVKKTTKTESEEVFIPDQLKQPTLKPTLHWIFQLLSNITIVVVKLEGLPEQTIFEGLTPLKQKLIGAFGLGSKKVYGLD